MQAFAELPDDAFATEVDESPKYGQPAHGPCAYRHIRKARSRLGERGQSSREAANQEGSESYLGDRMQLTKVMVFPLDGGTDSLAPSPGKPRTGRALV